MSRPGNILKSRIRDKKSILLVKIVTGTGLIHCFNNFYSLIRLFELSFYLGSNFSIETLKRAALDDNEIRQ